MGWKGFSKTLTSASAEPIVATSQKASNIKIQMKRDNGHPVYVGASDVSETNGIELINVGGTNLPLDKVDLVAGYGSGMDLLQIYVLGTIGEGVQGMYEEF